MESGENSGADDEQILRLARSLCEQLNCPSVSPVRVSWQEQYSRNRYSHDKYGNPIGRSVTPHYPLLDKGSLVLNPLLRGELGIEDWRPLLASSVIFYARLSASVNRRAALRFAPALLLALLLLLDLFLRGSIINGWWLVILAVVMGATGVLGLYSSLLVSRKFMLRADKIVAEQMGTQPLLEALQKIQALREMDEKEEKMTVWAWEANGKSPSLERRIRNLQSDTGPA